MSDSGQVRTLLVYLFQVDGTMNYAKLEQLAETAEPEVKGRVMSIAEELIEKGLQQGIQQGVLKGLDKGTLIGRIQAFQKVLHEPVSDTAQLRDLPLAALAEFLARLEERLQRHSD